MSEKVLTGPSGECPKCGSNDLDYGSLEVLDTKIVDYPFTCNSCGEQGRETWGLAYGETEIIESEEE